LTRALIAVHRWLGVALCLLFLIWFLSGIGMMYWDFPAVTAQDRLDRAAPLDATTIRLSPDEAYARLRSIDVPTDVRLNTFDGRPVYRFRRGRDEAVVYADTGELRTSASAETMRRIAAQWTRQPANRAVGVAIDEPDQWTVQGPLRTVRPLWKFSWPNGDQVYVARATGEVVQSTTTASRIGAYLGPIPHWLYFTPLRQHQSQWSAVVIWSSGLATFTSALGIVIGVWMSAPRRRIPYRGQKRWHTVFGLIFGIGAVTWAFSGMLSMDPFPSAPPRRSPDIRLRAPVMPAAFARKPPTQALGELGALVVAELELISVGDTPMYVATLADRQTRIVPIDAPVRSDVDGDRIQQIVMTATRGAATVTVLDRYDRYYLDRRGEKPLPVLVATLADPDRTRVYIDPKTARIVGSYSSRAWVTRWLYHGLHSLDFPLLYAHRPAWDLVVIAFMVGGAALSVTSIMLAWRVVFGR
jgi:PepSY-associated transmembrane protein